MDAKFLGQKLRDINSSIPRIMSATVVSDFADPAGTFVSLDTAPTVPAPAQSLMGSWAKGTRVKCLAYPPRGLLILGSNESVSLLLSALRQRLLATNDVSMTSLNHAFQIGPDSGLHLAMDNNELQVRTGPSVAGVFPDGNFSINLGGGDISLGNAASLIDVNGSLNVDGDITIGDDLFVTDDVSITGVLNAPDNFETGSFTAAATPGGAGGTSSTVVNFAHTFPTTPRIVVTPRVSAAGSALLRAWGTSGASTTQFTLNLNRTDTATTLFDYIAISGMG